MPKYCRMNQTRAALVIGHTAVIVGHCYSRRIDTERPESLTPVGGLGEPDVGRLGGFIPFLDRHMHSTGRMTRIKRRPIARIQIPDWTK